MAKTRHLASALFLLLILGQLAFPFTCPAVKKQIQLAAVIGENEGNVFSLEVELQPGNGTIFTSIFPLTGYSTQESEQQAVDYAFSSTGLDKSKCDVFFRIMGDFGDNKVDGPSAGAAMAMATRAALLGKAIRQDIVVTGTISPEGKVGEVGGIIEKSTAAAAGGASHILVPSLKIYESFLLSSLGGDGGFTAIEVQDIPRAEAILFSSPGEAFSSNFSPKSKSIPSSIEPLKYDAETGRFSLVAKEVVEELDSTSRSIFNKGGEANPALEQYFSDEIAKYNEMIRLGYPFSAANSAFLLSIDAQYVRLGDGPPDLDSGFATVASCIESLPETRKTRENFHWATGADLRRIWAESKLNSSYELRAEQGGYITLRDLFFAYSWCQISKSLGQQADEIGGAPINESSLSSLAEAKLIEAEELLYSSPTINYDSLWHLENGFEANRTGLYGAAVYEATYAISMQENTNDAGGINVTSAVEKSIADERSSLWGKIYYGQGKYLYYDAKDGGFAPADANSILRYSSELDKSASEIDSALSGNGAKINGPAAPFADAAGKSRDNLAVSLVLSFSMIILGLAALLRAFSPQNKACGK